MNLADIPDARDFSDIHNLPDFPDNEETHPPMSQTPPAPEPPQSPTTAVLTPKYAAGALPESAYRSPILPEEEKFQPLIEINFDEPAAAPPPPPAIPPEVQPEEPAPSYISRDTQPAAHRHAPEEHIRSPFVHHGDGVFKNKKNIVMIAAAVALLLVSVIVFLLVSGSSHRTTPDANLPGTPSGAAIQPAGSAWTPPDFETYSISRGHYPRPITSLPVNLPHNVSAPSSSQPPEPVRETPPPDTATAEIKTDEDKKTEEPRPETVNEPKEELKTTEKDKKEPSADKSASPAESPKNEPPKTDNAGKKSEPPTHAEPAADQPKPTAEPTPVKPEPAAETPPAENAIVQEGQVVPESEADTPPAAIKNPPVQLTDNDTRTLGQNQELVMVRYLVDHNGNVETVRLLRPSSSKRINSIIEKTVSGWKFKPALKNNLRVRVWKSLSLTIKK